MKYVSPLIFVVILLASPSAHGQVSGLRPIEHPNHYIVLIDASASTSLTATKKAAYRRALTENLVNHLYVTGFGDAIPAYDPNLDKLTLLHFGVVSGSQEKSYSRIAGYDFLRDFIHPVFIRQSEIDITRVRNNAVPAQYYQYTILSWARQLALWSSRPTDVQENANRTFMIVINDGLPNENSTRGEIDLVSKWGGSNYQRVNPIVEQIDRNYRFMDGHGEAAAAWSETVSPENAPIFIEAFEVLSKSQIDWESRAVSLQPLRDPSIQWVNTIGNSPHGVLKANLNDDYKAWTADVNGQEVFLSATGNRERGSNAELVVPIASNEQLTCVAKSFEVTLSSSLSRIDPLLGKRTITYNHSKNVVAPLPLTCRVWFTVLMGLSILATIAVLLGLAYFLHNRLKVTQLYLDVPGTLGPIRLNRRGQREGVAMVLPQPGLEPFSLSLPGRLKQWLFYRGATISISTDQSGSVNWSASNELPQLRLPLGKGRIRAYWTRLPTMSCAINVEFKHGNHYSELTLDYPAALPQKVRSDEMTAKDIKVWVALDLGSESMAAHYEAIDGKTGMIEMQRLSKRLISPSDEDLLQPELLREKIGNAERDSPRLRNRISFKHEAQPIDPDPDHATLCFAKDPSLYQKSLFRFFHREGGWPPTNLEVMPNPKILFQHQVGDIFKSMKVIATDGQSSNGNGLQYVRLSPTMLIKDLTTQVVVNFILESPELSRYRRENIHLTITVPNVYSLPHAEAIKQFVNKNVPNLGAVEVLSESDAVAYYALNAADHRADSPALLTFKTDWTRQFTASERLCLVTIDIGKGTTDLSCILVQQPEPEPSWFDRVRGKSEPPPDSRRRHTVQGKTGRSSGGNYLNYIFAQHFNNQLEEVGRKFPLLDEPGGTPFGFLKRAETQGFFVPQTQTLAELEKLIEQLKAAMDANYDIDEGVFPADVQRAKIRNIVDRIVEAVPPLKDESEAQRSNRELFRNTLIEAMFLPTHLDPFAYRSLRHVWSSQSTLGSKVTESVKYIFSRRTPTPPPSINVFASDSFGNSETAKLKAGVQKYVKENVDDLIDSLQSLVRSHQAISDDRLSIDSNSFVVVSGQASQFKPLRQRIKERCDDFGMPSDKVLKDLDPIALKEACCRGAVSFWQGKMRAINPKELHGTYGCIDKLTGFFQAFDMKKINTNGSDTVSFRADSSFYVVYTPRSLDEVRDRPPQLNDGGTALIGRVDGKDFELQYDRDALLLKIGKQDLSIGSFGSVDSSIFEKVWPEILESKEY